MRKRLFATLMLAAGMLFAAPAAALADGITMNGAPTTGSITVDEDTNTITVSGNATMSGTGNAFEISSDATLVFQDEATLTLTGYDNAFVVNNATLSGGGWNITDDSGMDLFRLKTSGKLNVTSSVDLNGAGTTVAESRAIVLESGSGQEVALADEQTLTANGFYRGMETGGASGYTISGQSREASIFDFSDNDCGMALSYFDSSATYENCKLEVSDCLTSGIFMRQDNAALAGLTIDNVWINCVNDVTKFGSDGQTDIAIRFHSNDFTIKDTKINIQNAWNTGLWICDGWNANQQNEILNTEISVKTVRTHNTIELYGNADRRKAITFVPYRPWVIDGCTITMQGSEDELMQGGMNIASDIQVSLSSFKARANMFGGTIKLQNTSVNTAFIEGADIGTQVGQFLEIGPNVVISNDHNGATWEGHKHYTALCDNVGNGFRVQVLGQYVSIPYDTSNLTPEQGAHGRIKVYGGSMWSLQETDHDYHGEVLYEESIPVNCAGESLTMFEVDADAFADYANEDGSISLLDNSGNRYDYGVSTPSPDSYRYIWAPKVTVTFGDTGESIDVPRGTCVGLVSEMKDGSWVSPDGTAFTADTLVTQDIVVSAQ